MAQDNDGPANFRDALEGVQYGQTDEETLDEIRESMTADEDEQEEAQTPAPEGEAEAQETPEAPDESSDKPEESPDAEAEPESAADEVDEDLEDEEAPGEESADDSGSGDEPDEETPAEEGAEGDEAEVSDEDEDDLIELASGEKVTPSQLKEKYENWQSEYTRQRQQDRETVQEYQERVERTQSLTEDMAQHTGLQEFLRHHPEALGVLVRNPEETRSLMSDSDALEQFWEEYELLQESPQMAKRFLEPGGEEEVSQEAQQRARVQRTTAIAQELDRVVETVGEEYPEVDAEAVGRNIVGLLGLSEENAQDPQAVHAAMDKAYALMFVEAEDGLFIDPKLVEDRFEVMQARQSKDAEREEEAAEEQNKQVDAELERKKERPPAPKGESPAPSTPEGDEMPDNFNDALQKVQRMHD